MRINPNSMFAHLDLDCTNTCFSAVFDLPLRSQPKEFHIACPACKVEKEVSNIGSIPNRNGNHLNVGNATSINPRDSGYVFVLSRGTPVRCMLLKVMHAVTLRRKLKRTLSQWSRLSFECHSVL